MALADDIQSLGHRAVADLASAHDCYADTKVAWRLVQDLIAAGQTVTAQNKATGTITTHAELAAKARRYVAKQLAEATFQQFISIFECFFFDLLGLWLIAFPQSLGKKTVDFKTVLELPDKDAITELIVKRELTEVLYDRPSEWFAYLETKVKLGCPTPDEIERIAEAKASRDLLVHNNGVANKGL